MNNVLSTDLRALKTFFDHWHLKINLEKMVVGDHVHQFTNFHHKELAVEVSGRILKHATNAISRARLDSELDYQEHVEAMARKVDASTPPKKADQDYLGVCSTPYVTPQPNIEHSLSQGAHKRRNRIRSS